LNVQIDSAQLVCYILRMEIEIQFNELVRFERERVGRTLAEPITHDRFDVPLVRKLSEIRTLWAYHATNFGERARNITDMMQNTNGERRIERGIRQRQVV